jgi:hypothetical protein
MSPTGVIILKSQHDSSKENNRNRHNKRGLQPPRWYDRQDWSADKPACRPAGMREQVKVERSKTNAKTGHARR